MREMSNVSAVVLRPLVEQEIVEIEKQIMDHRESYADRRAMCTRSIAFARKHMVESIDTLNKRRAELKTALKSL